MFVGGENKLGAELFALVQHDQGKGFVSDAVESTEDKNIIAMAEIALFYSERVSRNLRKFLKKHQSLRRNTE